ncbi:hypothetical protein [uncultured Desulfosarcina sp.]|uniref:hypothetical protein n=1 Tax=uncultured Desulfosarcina sp. TaxID=218289 RepID=UPI003747C776
MKLRLLSIISICLFCFAPVAHAALYDFNGYDIDVEAWAGSGENEIILTDVWNNVGLRAQALRPCEGGNPSILMIAE